MKKRKTYEVSVINKTYSKTYSDETKFYTSDTALELNFQLKEVEYDFDSAEIILLNIDDRSLVTRPVGKSAEGFTYELEDDIVEHYGEWKGQLKFNEGGEIYVSSPVGFRIENDLDNDMPPQLTEVNTWKNLRAIADGLIADIRSELELVAVKVSEIDGAESERQQAETQRVSAELSRVSAEDQRKIDHENRSDELAGKADRVIEPDDFITFQDFVGGRNLVLNTSDTDFRELTILNPTYLASYNTGLKVEQGATYTVSMFVGDLSTNVAIEIGTGNQYGYLTNAQTSAIVLKLNQINTFVVTFEKIISEYGALYFRFRSDSADNTVVRFNKLKVTKGSTVYPYTKAPEDFSEITQRDIDKYISTVLPSASDLAMKVDKKQEDWITLPLYNGAQHGASPLKVMKDEMGVVHFKGSLTNLRTGSASFRVPVGYRPDIGTTEAFIRIPVSLGSGREVNSVQINYVGNGYVTNPLAEQITYFDGVSYVAERG